MTSGEAIRIINETSSLDGCTNNEVYNSLRETVVGYLRDFSPLGENCELPSKVESAVNKYRSGHNYKNLIEIRNSLEQCWMNKSGLHDEPSFFHKFKPQIVGLIVSVLLLIGGLVCALVIFKEEGHKTDIAFYVIECIKDIMAGFASGSVVNVVKGKLTKGSLILGYCCGLCGVIGMSIIAIMMRYSALFSIGLYGALWLGITMVAVSVVGFALVLSYYKNERENERENEW